MAPKIPAGTAVSSGTVWQWFACQRVTCHIDRCTHPIDPLVGRSRCISSDLTLRIHCRSLFFNVRRASSYSRPSRHFALTGLRSALQALLPASHQRGTCCTLRPYASALLPATAWNSAWSSQVSVQRGCCWSSGRPRPQPVTLRSGPSAHVSGCRPRHARLQHELHWSLHR
jgi:hypothetical protein